MKHKYFETLNFLSYFVRNYSLNQVINKFSNLVGSTKQKDTLSVNILRLYQSVDLNGINPQY